MSDITRILLHFDLPDLFDLSFHEKCWYLLKHNEILNIKQLQKEIVTKFICNPDNGSTIRWKHIQLFVNQGLVPSWEDSRILYANDVVRVCYRTVLPSTDRGIKRPGSQPASRTENKRPKSHTSVEDQATAGINSQSCENFRPEDEGQLSKPDKEISQPTHASNLNEIPKCNAAELNDVEEIGERKRTRRRGRRVRPTKGKRAAIDVAKHDNMAFQHETDSTAAPEHNSKVLLTDKINLTTDTNPMGNGHLKFDSNSENETDMKDMNLPNENVPLQPHIEVSSEPGNINLKPNGVDLSSDFGKKAHVHSNEDGFNQGFVSSKAVNHVNSKATAVHVVSGVQVFNRRHQKKKSNFPFSEASQISSNDVYTNKSFVYQQSDQKEARSNQSNQNEARSNVFPSEPKFIKKSVALETEPKVTKPPPKDYSAYQCLHGAPRIGDVIAYKVLEMSEDYTPGLSDYKEAKVLSFDPISQKLALELILCKAATTTGRFHLQVEYPDEILTVPKEQVGQQIELQLKSLVEPKLIS